jgi:hypothetical protein
MFVLLGAVFGQVAKLSGTPVLQLHVDRRLGKIQVTTGSDQN